MGESQVPVDQKTPHLPDSTRPSSEATAPNLVSAVLEIIKEMGAQREALQQEHERAARERRSEHRWRLAFQALFFGSPVLLGILYFLFFLSSAGFNLGPFSDVVGVVRVEGEISSNKVASADRIVPALESAFSNRRVKAIVLSIDSPGGAPVEAERIATAIATFKKKYDKPCYSVINSLGASAAYMVAMHTDQIVAGKNSIVGSVGAISSQWQLDKALARLEISQRVYASGKLKAFLNPFTPTTPEADLKAKRLVEQVGSGFVRDLRQARGKVLKDGVDFGTGEVWGGEEAKELGLVDSINTIEGLVASKWGLKTYEFGPREAAFGPLSSSIASLLASAFEKLLAGVTAPTVR